MAYLRHSYNGDTLTLIELAGDALIGRHTDCDIIIDDPTVSARHAHLHEIDGGYLIEDLLSTNGVKVEGELVQKTFLREGNIFELGTHAFEYLAHLPTDLAKTLKIKKSWIPGLYYTQ